MIRFLTPGPANEVTQRAVSWRRRGVVATVLLLVFTGVAMLWTTFDWASMHLQGHSDRVEWVPHFGRLLPQWLMWWALTPVIVAAARRLPITGGGWRIAIPAHVVFGVVLCFVHTFLYTTIHFHVYDLGERIGFHRLASGRAIASLDLEMTAYFAIAGGFYALTYSWAYVERRREAERLERLLVETRLSALRMQLNPHFLFNTLNTVSSLMEHDVRGARRTIASLSELLRSALEDRNGQEESLEDELMLLDKYIDIQRIRFGSRLQVNVRADADARRVQVPRLVLQPLVENAIRHGLSPRAGIGSVMITADIVGDRLRIEVQDDGVGLPAELVEGVGLDNTRARLEHLYGAAQTFTIAARENGGTVVRITLPTRTTASHS